MTVKLFALGCKVNQYDAEAVLEAFRAGGYRLAPEGVPADVVLVHTCTVTDTAQKKSQKAIRRALRENPGADAVVAGCLAQQLAEGLLLPGVRLVIGSRFRGDALSLYRRARAEGRSICAVSSLRDAPFEELSVVANEGKTRAVLKIQEGCRNRCAYCIIPSVRGPVRSMAPEAVREHCESIARAGFSEIVLVGIHLCSWGSDLPSSLTLPDAVRIAAQTPGLLRVRLGSLEPARIDRDFARRLGMPQLCPQFHLSLQSGCDATLRRMRRGYTRERYLDAVAALRETFPGCAITTDVIAGFPGETEEEFAETCRFCREIGFSRLHVFPFSEREGTPAAEMPDPVPPEIRHRRASELIAIGRETASAYLEAQIGRTVEVLVEGEGEGYTREYVRARVEGAGEGEIVRACVVGTDGETAVCERAETEKAPSGADGRP